MALIKIREKTDHAQRNGKRDRSGDSEFQWDALVLTLWASRLLGLAPVQLHKNHRGCPASVSPPWCIYGYILILILNAGALTGLILDLYQDKELAVRVNSTTARFAFVFEIILLFLITNSGVFGARKRLERCIEYWNIISKINNKIENGTQKYYGKRAFVVTAIYIIFPIVIHYAEFISNLSDAYYCHDIRTTIVGFYWCFFTELIIHFFVEIQFAWIALFIVSTLSNINKAFEDLVDIIDLNSKPVSFTSKNNLDLDFFLYPARINKKENVSKPSAKETTTGTGSAQIKGVPETFRRLVVLFGSVCDVIAGVNDCFGLILVAIIGSVLLHLVVTPFNFSAIWARQTTQGRTFDLANQILFIIYHISSLLLVVEPGNMTIKQFERTQTIANRLMRRAASLEHDPIDGDISLLLTQLELNKVCYTPMNMFTLDRRLIIKIMSAATTYLVIIFQFKQLDKS